MGQARCHCIPSLPATHLVAARLLRLLLALLLGAANRAAAAAAAAGRRCCTCCCCGAASAARCWQACIACCAGGRGWRAREAVVGGPGAREGAGGPASVLDGSTAVPRQQNCARWPPPPSAGAGDRSMQAWHAPPPRQNAPIALPAVGRACPCSLLQLVWSGRR